SFPTRTVARPGVRLFSLRSHLAASATSSRILAATAFPSITLACATPLSFVAAPRHYSTAMLRQDGEGADPDQPLWHHGRPSGGVLTWPRPRSRLIGAPAAGASGRPTARCGAAHAAATLTWHRDPGWRGPVSAPTGA